MSEDLNLSIFNGISDLVFLMKVENNRCTYAFINQAAKRYTGLTNEAIGLSFEDVLPKKVALKLKDIYLQVARTKTSASFEDTFVSPDNQVYYGQSNMTPIMNEDGVCTHILTITRDITETKHYEKHLEQLVYIDDLTGIPNRRYLFEQLEGILQSEGKRRVRGAVLYLDGDDFKRVNDCCGHAVGDEYLQRVAHMLQGMIRDQDIVARISGDEFAIVLVNTFLESDMKAFMKRIEEFSSEPLKIQDHLITPSFSIGIACFPEDGTDVETLLKNADDALYYSKHKGKNSYHFYRDILSVP